MLGARKARRRDVPLTNQVIDKPRFERELRAWPSTLKDFLDLNNCDYDLVVRPPLIERSEHEWLSYSREKRICKLCAFFIRRTGLWWMERHEDGAINDRQFLAAQPPLNEEIYKFWNNVRWQLKREEEENEIIIEEGGLGWHDDNEVDLCPNHLTNETRLTSIAPARTDNNSELAALKARLSDLLSIRECIDIKKTKQTVGNLQTTLR